MTDEYADSLVAPHGRVELVLGSIVDQAVDAIVNAANTKLAGGGGVDGAIHRAAGPALAAECQRFPADENGRRCPTGDVRVTAAAGRLAAQWVIHAVGPFYSERHAAKAAAQLRDVHRRALEAAAARGCRSIAFPAISTGAYRFPLAAAAPIAVGAARDWLQASSAVEVVRFVLFKPAHLEAFRSAARVVAAGMSDGDGRRNAT
jgi:O-acetyl-ADP-ribose deacetylase (regulator of RNase III)